MMYVKCTIEGSNLYDVFPLAKWQIYATTAKHNLEDVRVFDLRMGDFTRYLTMDKDNLKLVFEPRINANYCPKHL